MRTHATAQLVGGRPRQCDRTAVVAAPRGVRAYALLDGVGSTPEVARWTRRAAHRVATSAARHRDAEAGLRAAYDHYAGQRRYLDPFAELPHAAAVVAVTAPGRPLTVAWCGDSRAYLLQGGTLQRLTDDHNDRRVNPPYGAPNLLTSALGAVDTDEAVEAFHGHPAVESASRLLTRPARLLLASDGAYEPLEESAVPLADYLHGPRDEVALTVTESAVECWGEDADNATALVVDLH